MPKIFMTGASGLIGSYILKYLVVQGYENIVLYGRSTDPRWGHYGSRVEFLKGDILDFEHVHSTMQGCQWVIHAAGLVSAHDEQELLDVNVDGTANVANACVELGVERFLHISSTSTLGKSAHRDRPINEDDLWEEKQKTSIYAHSKHLGELEAWRAQAEGVPTVVVNPAIALGSGNWNNSSLRIFQEVQNGLKYYPTGSSGFVDARDLAIICHELISGVHQAQRYVVSGHNEKYKRVLDLISTGLKVQKPHRPITPSLVRILPFVSRYTGLYPNISKEILNNTSQDISFDSSKVLDELGFTFRSLEDTITDCCHSFNTQHSNGTKLAQLPDF